MIHSNEMNGKLERKKNHTEKYMNQGFFYIPSLANTGHCIQREREKYKKHTQKHTHTHKTLLRLLLTIVYLD